MKSIYDLKLHEVEITPECRPQDSLFTSVMRVPGGFIYRSFDKSSNVMGCVFVPFNNEFQDSATTFEKPEPRKISEDV